MKRLTVEELGITQREIVGIPEEALPANHDHLIAFGVAGDCMSGDAITDGDVVIVDPELMPADGDIAAFGLMNEGGRISAILKRLSRSEGTVRLVPSNPAHAPIAVINDDDLLVIGTVVAWVHRIC
jgi:SOS-response transcriptional repressor LexA